MEMQETLRGHVINYAILWCWKKKKAANAFSKAQTRNAKPASTVSTMQQTKDCIFSFKCKRPIKRHIQNYFKTLIVFNKQH